jgi:lipopolysaccharide transport system ATP-binding protein
MYVRLAFAVAAHLESEILIVDEVLAVGDAEFQKKCLGKVKEVASGGRTVLFVSHNMGAIQQLCTSVLCLKSGMVEYHGEVERGMQVYFSSMRTGRDKQEEELRNRKNANKKAYVSGFDVELLNDGKKLAVTIDVEAAEFVDSAEIAVGINNMLGIRLITLHSRFTGQKFDLQPGQNRLVCVVEDFYLRPGAYLLDVSLGSKYDTLDYLETPLEFEVPEYSFYPTAVKPEGSQGEMMATYRWSSC